MNLVLLISKREQHGLTQEEMAKQLGYKDKSSYCLIENGKVKVSTETASKIKRVLNLSSEDVMDIFFETKVEDTQTTA